MHGNFVISAIQRHDRGRLRAGEEGANFRKRFAWCMQHDVFAFTDLEHAVEALQHAVDQRLFFVRQCFLGLDDDGLTIDQCLQLDQAIGSQRGAS